MNLYHSSTTFWRHRHFCWRESTSLYPINYCNIVPQRRGPNNLCFFDLEPVFQSLRATSCAHLQRGVKSLVATGSTNLKSSPRVEYSTNSVVSTTMIVTSSPAPTTAPVTKPQRVPNPLGVPGNRRQNRSGMETNRLPMLDILLIAVCSGFTAVIGLAACFCILKKRRSTRFVSFFNFFLNVFALRKPGLITCHG